MDQPAPPMPLAILSNRLFKAGESDFFSRLAADGYVDIRMRHTALFEALQPDGVRISHLAERLGMTPQAMGELLDDVEAGGYIARTPDPGDRRARLIVLTERGRVAIRRCYEILASIEREYADFVGEGEYAQARDTMQRLLARLEAPED